MTAREAAAVYAVHEYTTSVGDNLTRIVRLLYGSDVDKAYETIKELNLRYDWAYLKGGETIKYFPEEVLYKIDVVYSQK